MNRTTSDLAFIHGYMLVANSTAGVSLTLDDPSWDDVLAEHRHLYDVSPRYHEAHITIEPRPDVGYHEFLALVPGDWRASRFEHDDVDHIEGKWFLSARHSSLAEITAMVDITVLCLREAGLTVLRHKIEDAVRDTKCGDPM